MKTFLLFCFFLSCAFADSITLLNDTQYTLKALIYDANSTLMGEFILNPRDATEWSNNDQNFGTSSPSETLSPYTIDWICMSGAPYASCGYVAAGATVTAQGCQGNKMCTPQSTTPGNPPMTTKP